VHAVAVDDVFCAQQGEQAIEQLRYGKERGNAADQIEDEETAQVPRQRQEQESSAGGYEQEQDTSV
jgi:hypothetical protein